MLGVKDSGRAPMAWGIRPVFRGDLNLVRRRMITREGSDRVRIRYEPARWCTESCAACSVACLEVNMRGRKNRFQTLWPLGFLPSLPETMLAKEAKIMDTLCCGKHLGCPKGAGRGLQYGLSGNRVFMMATHELTDQTETAHAATVGSVRGKPTRPKP